MRLGVSATCFRYRVHILRSRAPVNSAELMRSTKVGQTGAQYSTNDITNRPQPHTHTHARKKKRHTHVRNALEHKHLTMILKSFSQTIRSSGSCFAECHFAVSPCVYMEPRVAFRKSTFTSV